MLLQKRVNYQNVTFIVIYLFFICLPVFHFLSIFCLDINKINFWQMQKQKSKSKLLLNRTISLNPNVAELEEDAVEEIQYQKPSNDQNNVHQFILTQFKEKYDQLKNQFQAKKREADSLLYDKKKLQIELLNHNVEYYEKEICRLRQEVEKYQMENEENKHKFLVAQNSRKQIEAVSKVRHQQLKKTLKQLQKQKITVVQQKYQIVEKEKTFTKFLSDVQKSNQDISKRYDEAAAGKLAAENQLKIKNVDIQNLKRQLEVCKKTIKEQEQAFSVTGQKHQLSQYRSKNRIEDLQQEIKDLTLKDKEKIIKLQAQIRQLESKRKTQQFILFKKEQQADYAHNLSKKEETIAHLEQIIRFHQYQLSQKIQVIHSLEQKLKNICSIELLNESEEKLIQTINKYSAQERFLQGRIKSLEKQLQLEKLRQSSSSPERMRSDFQQLLKNQISENSKLKLQLSLKIDQIFTLKNSIEQQQQKESLLENEIDILKKRQKVQEKNSKIGYEIQIQNLKNDIQSLRRKLQVTQTRLSIKIKQVKDKDNFISSVVIGRSRQQDVPFVVAEIKRIFQAQYVNRLMEANMKIDDLTAKLSAK